MLIANGIACAQGELDSEGAEPPITPVATSATAVEIAQLPGDPLERALLVAGENRQELEGALREWPMDRNEFRYMRMLIEHMRPYDLANASREHIVKNVKYAVMARKEAPWGRELNEELFTDWVLPYRIADEDLDAWREPFYEQLHSIAYAGQDTKAAIQALYTWYWKGKGGGSWARFVVTENRDQAPRQLLDHTGRGRCFELNLCFVAMARSVGVPIRHCGSMWVNHDQYHYWIEYWNTTLKKWERLDASQWVTGKYFMADARPFGAVYALPPFPLRRDQIGTEYRTEFIQSTEGYKEHGLVRALSRGDAAEGKPLSFQVYVWNSSSWRPISDALASDFNAATFSLQPTRGAYPYLISANAVNGMAMGIAEVNQANSKNVTLKTMLENESISIPLSRK